MNWKFSCVVEKRREQVTRREGKVAVPQSSSEYRVLGWTSACLPAAACLVLLTHDDEEEVGVVVAVETTGLKSRALLH